MSSSAVENHCLYLIKSGIEDNPKNTTYFAFIRKGTAKRIPAAATRTSIAFHFKKDSPGLLNTILQIFAEAEINLAKIESRPSSKLPGAYVFYIDFEGRADNPVVQNTLKTIQGKVAKLKIFGTY